MLPRLRAAMARPARRLPRHDAPPEASVAAVFYGPDADLLFIRRATVPGDPWSGHIAFPGGRREVEDSDLLATAIRETHEELGLDLSAARYLGELDELGPVSRRKPLVVRPHVFHLDRLPAVRPNREVAEVMRLSLGDLLGNVGRGPMPFEWNGQALELARVDFAGARLWGMTLRMVDDLLHRIDGEGMGLRRIGLPDPS